jgi:uncharacterized protein (TIGR02678 family)
VRELDDDLAAERAVAVRQLLARPLLDAEADRDEFRLVVRHASWLIDYFEQTCGWPLTVDAAAGFARLAKRSATVGANRPLRRVRGAQAPFDRRRYELLCRICAELIRHPVTTVGMLASAITADARLDTSRYSERTALVDALRVLAGWGAVRITAGEVDAFVDSEQANAILTADTARLHRLIVSAYAPSAVVGSGTTGIDPAEAEPVTSEIDPAIAAIAVLAAEPRYQQMPGVDDADATSDEARNRRARHRLGRRVLDDPVLYLDDLEQGERDYLASISGRRWLRDRAEQAGLELEERAEGLLPIDPDGIATDLRFPGPHGNAHQLALLLADRLVSPTADGGRRLARLDPDQLRDAVRSVLHRFPAWARGRRDGDGPDLLLTEALDLLIAFGLARRDFDGSVTGLPALARYRVGEPTVAGARTLFEEA